MTARRGRCEEFYGNHFKLALARPCSDTDRGMEPSRTVGEFGAAALINLKGASPKLQKGTSRAGKGPGEPSPELMSGNLWNLLLVCAWSLRCLPSGKPRGHHHRRRKRRV
jgi:hypothetical protein